MSNEITISISQDNIVDMDFTVSQDNPIDFKLEQDSTVKDMEITIDLGTGIQKVYHSDDFTGAGLEGSPLTLSTSFYDKLDAKYGSFKFEQAESTDVWLIEHNLNRFPSVSVVDSGGTIVECRVTYLDENTCRLEMNAPFKGTAYLN